MRRISDPRTLGDLLRDLRDELTTLFRQEVQLAKVEMTNKARQVGKDSSYIAAGAGVALVATIVFSIALSAAMAALFSLFLNNTLAMWLGPLVAALLLGGLAWWLVQHGLDRLRHENLKPEKTVQTLREDKQWLQEKFT